MMNHAAIVKASLLLFTFLLQRVNCKHSLCPKNFKTFVDIDYCVNISDVTFDYFFHARDYCTQRSAHMFTPDSKHELRMVVKHADFNPIWLGYVKMTLTATMHPNGSYSDHTNSVLYNLDYFGDFYSFKTVPKQLWKHGRPDNLGGKETCTRTSGKNKIDDVECRTSQGERFHVACVTHQKHKHHKKHKNKQHHNKKHSEHHSQFDRIFMIPQIKVPSLTGDEESKP